MKTILAPLQKVRKNNKFSCIICRHWTSFGDDIANRKKSTKHEKMTKKDTCQDLSGLRHVRNDVRQSSGANSSKEAQGGTDREIKERQGQNSLHALTSILYMTEMAQGARLGFHHLCHMLSSAIQTPYMRFPRRKCPFCPQSWPSD